MIIETLNVADFPLIYIIMEKSFPEDERRPYNEQEALLRNPLYRIYIARESDEKSVQGFAAVWEFDKFAFVEHLAVEPSNRNKGIGARILEMLHCSIGKKLCLEVEPPKDEMSVRRIAFYKRNHFFFNDYEYFQPPISEGKNPVQLYIMTSESEITEQEFLLIKSILYKKVYGVVQKRYE